MSGNVGISTYLADKWLNELNSPGCWFQPFTGIPGANGTENLSAMTTRVLASFAPAAGGIFVFTGIPPIWLMTTSETISHVGAFDGADPGANFLFSGAAVAARVTANGDKLALGGFTLKFLKVATD